MSNKLLKFFNIIKREKLGITNVRSGRDFEINISYWLKKSGFEDIYYLNKEDLVVFLDDNKDIFQDKNSDIFLKNNTGYKDIFIYQPYKQNYPDFLVFTDDYIYPIECKYTSQSSKAPVWNNNLPKENGIYIFGSSGLSDLTFFRGEDVLPREERIFLNKFFDQLDVIEEFQNTALKKMKSDNYLFEYGFHPYIRTSFKQNKLLNKEAKLNFFDNEVSSTNEEKLKDFIKEQRKLYLSDK